MMIDSKKGLFMMSSISFTPPVSNIQTFSTVMFDDDGNEKDVNYHRLIIHDTNKVMWFDNNMTGVDKADELLLEKMYLKRLKFKNNG